MKDLYSFSRTEKEFRDFYEQCAKAYLKIFARVGLGVHYPSDVVGGLALGWAWVFWWRDWSRRPRTSASADTA